MKLARWIYGIAAIYGFLVLAPMYFLERMISTQTPPAITHPEFFYGFVGLGLAWQVAFAVIATDPIRYRPIMCATLVEKFSFAIAVIWLVSVGRTSASMLVGGIGDLALGLLFIVAIVATSPRRIGRQ